MSNVLSSLFGYSTETLNILGSSLACRRDQRTSVDVAANGWIVGQATGGGSGGPGCGGAGCGWGFPGPGTGSGNGRGAGGGSGDDVTDRDWPRRLRGFRLGCQQSVTGNSRTGRRSS